MTCGKEDISFDQVRPNLGGGEEIRGKIKREKGEKKIKGERGSSFSLVFPEIRPSTFVGARDKVDPHSESYVWVLKSRSFDKLQKVGDFPTRCYF